MPPANSPSDTRPSTPPTNRLSLSENSLSTSPYLQQLEEAISTPVPDLAATLNLNSSTLNTTPSRGPLRDSLPRIQSRTEDAWDGRTVLHLSRDDDSPEFISERGQEQDFGPGQEEGFALHRSYRESMRRRLYLSEAEFQSWTSDNQRRAMQSQNREQGWRSRMREVRPRDDHTARIPAADGGRESYATSGGGPMRQRLYDWAATHDRSRSTDPDNEVMAEDEGREEATARPPTTDNDAATRRELDRALRNYRIARNALRSGRNTSSDLGAVPTASALRAYWNEELPEVPSMSELTGRTSSYATNEIADQHQRERQRRHLELARLHAERRLNQLDSATSSNNLRERQASDAFMRVRSTIRYLSELRHTSVQDGLELARNLGLDSLYESPDMNTPSDLPMTIESLPVPQHSSWLQPGVVWHGLQSTDRETNAPPPLASTLRRERQREYLRRAMARRGFGSDPPALSTTENGRPSSSALVAATNTVLTAERYLSDFFQDSNGRWGFGQSDGQPNSQFDPASGSSYSARILPSSDFQSTVTLNPPVNPTASDADHWPVVVTLHSVDLDNMTVSGTMSASQIPDKNTASIPASNMPFPPESSATTVGKSMESFFEGEIIDFRHHALETDGRRFNYRIGGIDVDARYWARLGPFRKEIEKASIGRRKASMNNGGSGGVSDYHKLKGLAGVSGSAVNREETETVAEIEAREIEADEVMARCLGSRKWIQEKLGSEWVLMRWKEKCFVTPLSLPPSNTHIMSTSNTSPSTASPQSIDQTAWGLTISGFYYIALNRITGSIDGLYYDPGSQPYQALRMVPQGMKLDFNTAESEGQERDMRSGGYKSGWRGGGSEHLDIEREKDKAMIGVKRWFPAVEFR